MATRSDRRPDEPAAKPIAKNTERAYRAAWDRFTQWCDQEGYSSLPATPEAIAEYLMARATEGRTVETLRQDRAAIRYEHQKAGQENPTAYSAVSAVFDELRADPKPQVNDGPIMALTGKKLVRIKRSLGTLASEGQGVEDKASVRAARTIAMISVMRDSLLRPAQAIELRWDDITFRSDGSARATIRGTNRNTEGAYDEGYIGRDAAAALKAIQPATASGSDRVFGLRSSTSVGNRIAATAKAAGLPGRFSGQSPRIGMMYDLRGLVAKLYRDLEVRGP